MEKDWQALYTTLKKEYDEFRGSLLIHSIETTKELEDALEEQNNDLSVSLDSYKRRNNELQFEIDELKVFILPTLGKIQYRSKRSRERKLQTQRYHRRLKQNNQAKRRKDN